MLKQHVDIMLDDRIIKYVNAKTLEFTVLETDVVNKIINDEINPKAKREVVKFRDLDMFIMYVSGQTLDSIGKKYGFTRERARQIVAREKSRVKFSFEELIYSKTSNKDWLYMLTKFMFKINSGNFREYLSLVSTPYTLKTNGIYYESYELFDEKFELIFSEWIEKVGENYKVKNKYKQIATGVDDVDILLENFGYKFRFERNEVIDHIAENNLFKTKRLENEIDINRRVIEKLKRKDILTSLDSASDKLTILPKLTNDEKDSIYLIIEKTAQELLDYSKIISFSKIFENSRNKIEQFKCFSEYYDDEIKAEQVYLIFKNRNKLNISLNRYPTLIKGRNMTSFDGACLYLYHYLKRRNEIYNLEYELNFSNFTSEFYLETGLQEHFLYNIKSDLISKGIISELRGKSSFQWENSYNIVYINELKKYLKL